MQVGYGGEAHAGPCATLPMNARGYQFVILNEVKNPEG